MQGFSYLLVKEVQKRHYHPITYRSGYLSLVLKKTFESIFFDRISGFEEVKIQIHLASKIVEVTFDIVEADTFTK